MVRSIGPASRGASLVAVARTNILRIRTGTPAGARRLAVTHTRSPILSSSPRRARAFFPGVLARQFIRTWCKYMLHRLENDRQTNDK